ncbi:MAG: Fur family ferric uptake transcriptional regulator [Crocinitomix sp.]|jgi:Fur family ferric uptake transcriptional regulator
MKRRNTPTKKKILKIFEGADEAVCSSMIEGQLKGNVDRSTVYRILKAFEKDGIIHKVVDPSGKIFYALCKKCSTEEHSHDHFHFKCQKCEKIECLDQNISIPKLDGYLINDFYGIINGLCQQCH